MPCVKISGMDIIGFSWDFSFIRVTSLQVVRTHVSYFPAFLSHVVCPCNTLPPIYLFLLHFCVIIYFFGLHFRSSFRLVSIVLHSVFIVVHFFKHRRGFAFLTLLLSCMFTFRSSVTLCSSCFWSLCCCTILVRWTRFYFCFLILMFSW